MACALPPRSRRPVRALRAGRVVELALGLASLATLTFSAPGCGGGGGGSGGGAPTATTGSVSGVVVLPDVAWGLLAEQEPNGSPARAQRLPPLLPDAEMVVAGEGSADGSRQGVVDAVDAFRLVAPVAVSVEVMLLASTGGVAAGNFDLAVLDTATGGVIASAATANNPEFVVVTLPADTPVDLVVTTVAGAGAYTLRLTTSGPIASLAAGSPATLVYEPGLAVSGDAIDYALEDLDCVPGRVLLQVDGDGRAADEALRELGANVVRVTSAGTWVVDAPTSNPRSSRASRREALSLAARLARVVGVVRAEPDAIVRTTATPNDPLFAAQWNLSAIGAPSAWDLGYGSSSVVVGVIDTGIVDHPDLDGQRVGGFDFVSDATAGGDGNGRDANPRDEGAQDHRDGTSVWHGSHVAGIVAARGDDGFGVVGVAPGCRVMPLRVIGRGGGTVSDLADALRYAAGLTGAGSLPPLSAPLRVVNLSLGTSIDVMELRNAVEAAAAAGVLLVASAGNDGGPVLYPAAYPEVMAVGAVDGRLVKAGYSNVGPELDLVAPGGALRRDQAADGYEDGILSTVLDETRATRSPSWTHMEGTSMASPHVAGAAALLFSLDPTLTAPHVRTILRETCRDLGVVGHDTTTGAGLLQVGEAVRRLLSDLATPRTDPPRLLLSSTAVRIIDGESVVTVNVTNAGGGILVVDNVAVSTDGVVGWLSSFPTAAPPGSPATASQIAIVANRTSLPTGSFAGTVFVRQGATVLGSIRVVVEVGVVRHLGRHLPVVLRRASTGGVVRSGFALPEWGYRYVFDRVSPDRYTVRAGTDLDDDGFFCEPNDACGHYGGATPAEIAVVAGERRTGIDVVLSFP